MRMTTRLLVVLALLALVASNASSAVWGSVPPLAQANMELAYTALLLDISPTPTLTESPTPTITPAPWRVHGMVYEDLNGSHTHDPGEPGVVGAVIAINDSHGELVDSQITGVNGSYSLVGFAEGTFRLNMTTPAGFRAVTDVSFTSPLIAGDDWPQDFGVERLPTPTPTHTLTPSLTPIPSATPTGPSPTPTASATPTSTPTITATPTTTKTPTASLTPTQTPTSWIDTSRAMPIYCEFPTRGDTTGKPNNATYYGGMTWMPESGPEDVYVLSKIVAGAISIELDYTVGDLDIFLLSAPNPEALIAWGDKEISDIELEPGVYYVVVDSFVGRAGPYSLTLEGDCGITPTPTSTLSPTPTNTPAFGYFPLVRRDPSPTPTRTPIPTPTPTMQPYAQAVNCGSPTGYQASDGAWYAPDQPHTSGAWGYSGSWQTFSVPESKVIYSTTDPSLYRSQRYATSKGTSAYRFTVPNGHYEVKLRFAELVSYTAKTQRVFDVRVEERAFLEHLDLVATVGRFTALDRTGTFEVSDGVLDITFDWSTTDYSAVINAIRVRRVE
jgi:hypothetical protein